MKKNFSVQDTNISYSPFRLVFLHNLGIPQIQNIFDSVHANSNYLPIYFECIACS